MEIPKTLPPEVESIYNEDGEMWSPAMTEILLAQLDDNFRALEEKEVVLFQNTKPGPRPPSTPSGGGDKTVHKGGSTIRGK